LISAISSSALFFLKVADTLSTDFWLSFEERVSQLGFRVDGY
jgi:hypothetical protein